MEYLLLYASVYIPQLHLVNMKSTASQVRNHYSQKKQKSHHERALERAFKKTAHFHYQSIFKTPTDSSCTVLEIANVRVIVLIMQDDDNTDREISNGDSKNPRVSTLSSNIEEDNFDIQHEVLHLDLAGGGKTLRTPRVPLPNKRKRADTVIAQTSLLNLQYSARAIVPPLLKPQKSTINAFPESDIVPAQALPLPNAVGNQSVAQPQARGDHNVPQHPKATFEVAKQFMEAMAFTKTPWPIISHEKYSILDEPWQLAIEGQDRQWALAGTSVDTTSVCQLPGGPFLKIDPQTQEAVSVYSGFCSLIGLMIVLNPKNIHSSNKRLVSFEGVSQLDLVDRCSVVNSCISDQRLRFECRLRRSCLTMLISRRSSKIRYHLFMQMEVLHLIYH